MYNEIDELRLKQIVICSYCESNNVKCIGSATMLAGIGKFIDQDGHEHKHDTNQIFETYQCINGHKFEIQPLNSCWCGWRQK